MEAKNEKITLMYDFLKELGGLERVMFFQANALKDYNVEMVFSHVSEKDMRIITKEFGLRQDAKISQIGKGNNEIMQYIYSFLFPSRIRRIKTGIMISNSFMTSRMAYSKKKKYGNKYMAVLHHPPNFLYSRNRKWVNNLPRLMAYLAGLILSPVLKRADIKAVRNADVVLVSSKYTYNRIKKIYGVNPVIVYPAVSEKFVLIEREDAEKILEKFNIEKKFILLHGRMIKDKRPDLAVRAFSLLDKDLLLVISGTIEEKEKIKELIRELKLEEKVKILGRVSEEELVALYNLAECFLMSAPKEDFGLTPVEAMACGTPVVAWKDNAGPEETIIDGINGFFSKPYDTNDFADKINETLERKWDKNKIRDSVKKFSSNNIKKEFLKVIYELSHK